MENKDENQNFSYVGDSWNQSLNRSGESFTRSFNSNNNQLPKIDPSKYNVTPTGQVINNTTNNTQSEK
ncbi:MAG: hypothetical protein J6R96_05140 [Spirochaetaceae bacterium]|nr:hypothetical protein [Spirochaetaceae bacterium]